MLLKSSALNAIAVMFKIISNLILNKVLAVYVGPSGYAIIGQFQNILNLSLAFSSGSIANGVTKYTAEYQNDEVELHHIWRTSFTFSLITSLLFSLILFVFSDFLSVKLFEKIEYSSYLKVFSFTFLFFSLNGLLLAIINGLKDVNKFVTVNIASSVLIVVLSAGLAFFIGLKGALLALTINQSVVFFITFFICIKEPWFKLKNFIGKFEMLALNKLSKFILMSFSAAVCGIVMEMAIRSHLAETLSWNDAGLWDAIWRMSSVYMLFITSSLGFYFLPKFSELKAVSSLRKELFKGSVFSLAICCSMTAFILIFQNNIIHILFTEEFNGLAVLFTYQFSGDIFKSLAWLFAMIIISKGLAKTYIVIQILYSFIFYILVVHFTDKLGLEGVAFAHFVGNFILLLAMVVLLNFFVLNRKKVELL